MKRIVPAILFAALLTAQPLGAAARSEPFIGEVDLFPYNFCPRPQPLVPLRLGLRGTDLGDALRKRRLEARTSRLQLLLLLRLGLAEYP